MSQLFISYKRDEESTSFVEHMKEHLEEAGFDVWIDQSLLRPGQYWIQEIDKAIRASIALIVVLTPEAHKSLYVTYEWSYALGRGMEVIPLLLEDTEIHRRLDDIQYIDFRNHWKLPWDDLTSRLIEIDTGETSKRRERPSFVQRAVAALDSYELTDREEAINRLTKSSHPSATEAIAEATKHHLDDVRIYASIRLADVTQCQDQRAIPGLLEAIQDPSTRHRTAAANWIVGYGEIVVPELLLMLDHHWAEARRTAINLLGKLQAVEAIDKLGDIIHNDGHNYQAAIAALVEIGNRSAIPILISALKHSDEHVRENAAGTLGAFDDAQVIAALQESIQDTSTRVQQAAQNSLVKLGPSSVPGLLNLVNHREKNVRINVVQILGRIRDTIAVEVLLEQLKDEADSRVRREIINSLRLIGDKRALPAVIDSLDDNAWEVVEIAVHTVSEWQEFSAIPKLAKMLRNRSPRSREISGSALYALTNMGTPEALDVIEQWRKENARKGEDTQ